MNIGIIDAEIVGKNKHRFPNLASMKISSYHKSLGDKVVLLLSYDDIEQYDIVYISKVFIKTKIPFEDDNKEKNEKNIVDFYKENTLLKKKNVIFGGTGFYYDKAPNLPYNIEHCMPDYHLYDDWILNNIKSGSKEKEFIYYKEYSIGFLTRGCFRKCEFCVNKKYNSCSIHSNINEFLDKDRKKLCFLDDNFFACKDYKNILEDVYKANRPFQFRQGLDERLLTEEKIKTISKWKYDGDFIFAFDNLDDADLIINKLELLYKTVPEWNREIKFYCFCGYDRNGVYDYDFWINDIEGIFKRIFILAKYSCLPYLMRHENYKNSPFCGLYNVLAAWINQPAFYSKMTFREYCIFKGMNRNVVKEYINNIDEYLKKYKKLSSWNNLDDFIEKTGEKFLYYVNTLPFSLAEFGSRKK